MYKRILLPLLIILMGISGHSQNTGLPFFAEKYNRSILGENIFLFDPSMDMKEVQNLIDSVFARHSGRGGEFSKNHAALLFMPGTYDLDIRVDYYIQVLGPGDSPEDVVIRGAVRSNTTHGNRSRHSDP